MIRSFRKRKFDARGVTFVEILLVMGLLSGFLLILVTIFTAVIDDQGQTEGYSAVVSDGRFITSRLDYDIARATAITTPATFGTNTSTLGLTIGTTYTYALSGNNLLLTDPTGTDNLNGNGDTVSNLSFQKIGNSGGKETIHYSFTLTSTAQHTSGADVQTFTSTVERH